jgi:hypothetical protein
VVPVADRYDDSGPYAHAQRARTLGPFVTFAEVVMMMKTSAGSSLTVASHPV